MALQTSNPFEDQEFFEAQYSVVADSYKEYGLSSLGLMSSFTWNNDPKRLLFVLSRYKSVGSMLAGEDDVLEIGCGDAFASRIVKQYTNKLTVTDADNIFLEQAKLQSNKKYNLNFIEHDFLSSSTTHRFSAAYLLDVLEHIDPSEELKFLANIKGSVKKYGKVIIGMPSLESQQYASSASKEGHINCQSKSSFANNLRKIFPSVTMFSMNDEVLHTGYAKMSHYILALCIC